MQIAPLSASVQPLLISMSQQQAGTRSIPFSPVTPLTMWQNDSLRSRAGPSWQSITDTVVKYSVSLWVQLVVVSLQSPQVKTLFACKKKWTECLIEVRFTWDWSDWLVTCLLCCGCWALKVMGLCLGLLLLDIVQCVYSSRRGAERQTACLMEMQGCCLLWVLPVPCIHWKPFAIFYVAQESFIIFLDMLHLHLDDLSKVSLRTIKASNVE